MHLGRKSDPHVKSGYMSQHEIDLLTARDEGVEIPRTSSPPSQPSNVLIREREQLSNQPTDQS